MSSRPASRRYSGDGRSSAKSSRPESWLANASTAPKSSALAAPMGAPIRAQGAREAAEKAAREADRAGGGKAEAWSIRMEGYGRPAQPLPSASAAHGAGIAHHGLSQRSRAHSMYWQAG
jgi:hypothetical protein